MKSIGEYTKANSFLESLRMGKNNISDDGIGVLAEYIAGNTTLNGLYIYSSRKISNFSLPILVKMIESSRLTDVKVNNSSFNKHNALVLPLALNAIKFGSPVLDLSSK